MATDQDGKGNMTIELSAKDIDLITFALGMYVGWCKSSGAFPEQNQTGIAMAQDLLARLTQ